MCNTRVGLRRNTEGWEVIKIEETEYQGVKDEI